MRDIPSGEAFKIPLLSQDKIAGRPLRIYLSSELGGAFMPALKEGDFLVQMEDDALDLFREDDLLLVRPVKMPALKPGMILATAYNGVLWPELVTKGTSEGLPEVKTPPQAGSTDTHYRKERLGYVIWSMREWPRP
jgi:hypothetical protein